MVTVGMLSHRANPETVFKSYAFAAVAKMEGIDFYYFSPGRVNLIEKSILGWVYEDGKWIKKKLPFPDVIYNCSSPMTEKHQIIIDELRKTIPFTSHSIGDKLKVYNKIKKAKTFEQYLIPSVEVLNENGVLELFDEYEAVVLKPSSGHKGENIIFIRKNNEQFTLQHRNESLIVKEHDFKGFIKNLIKTEKFIAQPYIQSKTKNGISYDFRLHVQKNGEGKWTLTSIYPRLASEGIVANLNNGGYTAFLNVFLKNEFGESYYNEKRYLEHFSVSFANHFDSLYNNELDELGIDIGLDQNHKIWLFEVNWRPGVPIVFDLELDVAKNTLHYARYLAKKNKYLMRGEVLGNDR